MKSCGVIVEYNPFHNGHRYHLEEASKQSQADVIVAVMSGNFLQRGEPAILDKWTRARQALGNGADLVIELPFAYAVQSADYFAEGGVKLLQALSVDSLCFGTDSDSEVDYQAFAQFEGEHSVEITKAFQKIKNNGMSYPQQMTKIFRELYPEWPLDFSSPNHILGMSYAKANQRYSKPMVLYPLKRQQTNYHDGVIRDTVFASATAVRQGVMEGQWDQIRGVVPTNTFQDLERYEYLSWQNFWPYLKYQLTTSTPEKLAGIYQMVEGIEYRLIESAKSAISFADFVSKVKTKRFTWARIQRLSSYVLNQVTATEINAVWENSYVHVLGFNHQGQQFLKEKRKTVGIPLITNIQKDNEKLLSLDIRTDGVYRLGNPKITEQNYYRSPIIIL